MRFLSPTFTTVAMKYESMKAPIPNTGHESHRPYLLNNVCMSMKGRPLPIQTHPMLRAACDFPEPTRALSPACR